MRLYLNATSKNKIGYTPDTLIVELGKKHYEYDVQGWTDYDDDGLQCRVKGELLKRDDSKDEYVEMTQHDKNELIRMLSNPRANVIVGIYPSSTQGDLDSPVLREKILMDTVSGGCGLLEFANDYANFEFATECYF